MFLNEAEVRKIIRARLLKEQDTFQNISTKELGDDEQKGGEVAADVGIATLAGVGTAVGAAEVASLSSLSALAAQGTTAAAAGGPPGWAIAAGVAAAAGVAYLLLDEGDVGAKVASILDGTWGAKTQKELSKIEEETKKKLKEAGMTDQLENFPSLQHSALKESDYRGWAKEFYDATKGSGDLAFGMGTDEDAIRDTIRKVGAKGSIMDLAITSVVFFKEYKKPLIKVLQEELSDEKSLTFTGDMKTYVRDPIDEIKNIICWVDGNGKRECYTEEELKKFVAETDKIIKEGGVVDKETKIIDPNSLEGNFVKRIQKIMNMYSTRENLGVQINEDGSWGPKTDGLWTKFLNHVVVNHKTFKTVEPLQQFNSGFHEWSAVSAATISLYPGYTGRMKGCLAFVTDGYNGNTDYGEGKLKISGGGTRPSPTRKKVRQTTSDDEPVSIPTGGRTGSKLVPTARVTLAGSGKDTLESIGFPANTSDQLVSTIATRVRGDISGGVINLTVVVNRNGKVTSVRVAPGQRRNPIRRQFENLTNVVRRFLEKAGSADNKLITPSKARETFRAKSRKFELVLDFPAGTY